MVSECLQLCSSPDIHVDLNKISLLLIKQTFTDSNQWKTPIYLTIEKKEILFFGEENIEVDDGSTRYKHYFAYSCFAENVHNLYCNSFFHIGSNCPHYCLRKKKFALTQKSVTKFSHS